MVFLLLRIYLLVQQFQFLPKGGNLVFLCVYAGFTLKILLVLFPNPLCLLLKCTDGVTPLDFGLVILVLAYIFFQNGLELLHPVFLFVQLLLHCVQKPFFHQPFLILAIGKQIRQAGFLQVHFFDNRFPLFVINLVLCQLVKILPGLGAVVHVKAIKFQGMVLLIPLKHLAAGSKIFKDNLPFPFFHHRQMVDVLQAWLLILADEIHQFQAFPAAFFPLLGLAHHHPSQHIAGPLVQRPLHKDEGGLIGGKIAFKGAFFRIPVTLVDERRRHHLHQYGFPAPVAQGKQGALPIEMEGFVANPYIVIVVIDIDQSYRIDFTHGVLLVPSGFSGNCSGLTGSSP